MKLFLDDVRIPKDCVKYMQPEIRQNSLIYLQPNWSIVRNYSQFCDWIIHNGLPELVSFDHDLGDEHYLLGNAKHTDWQSYYQDKDREMTGYDCAKWLVNYCIEFEEKLPDFLVHSMNASGKANIEGLLTNYKEHEGGKAKV